jgi:hypothetical protein
VCYFSFPQGQKLVLDALSHLSDISETSSQFGCWLNTWKNAVAMNTLDPQMMEYSVMYYSTAWFFIKLINFKSFAT